MRPTNAYCEALGISVPRLEDARKTPDANIYSLLIVALLERGAPLTLADAARRFEEAGIAPAERALASLKRCKPGRPPIYRDGDLYALVLDAHGGAMRADDVLAFVRQHGHGYGSQLSAESARYWRRGAPIRVRDDGLWELDRAHRAVRAAREAARARVASARRQAEHRPDPAVQEARRRHFERQRRAHGERLAGMRRALLHAFPAKRPEALVLLDVNRHTLTTWQGDALAEARDRLAGYEIIAAVDVRELLRTLGFEPGARRLGDLGPPQKTRTLNRRGRTLRITTTMLVQGSCNIGRPSATKPGCAAICRLGSRMGLLDEEDRWLDEGEVQAARLAGDSR